MQTAASTRRTWITRQTVTRAAAIALTALLLLAAAGVLTQSRLPRRAAGIYGGLYEKIRRHPQATAAICLTGVALTWCGIGLAAALEGPSARK
jgi:hypothetical protein